jgi:hypothetical protein
VVHLVMQARASACCPYGRPSPGLGEWFSTAVAAVHLVSWFGIVVAEGALARSGVVTVVVYPAFVVWLVAVIAVMIGRSVIGNPLWTVELIPHH